MNERLVGGECEYKQYEGYAKIISITKITEGNSYSRERYEVKFSFHTDKEIEEPYAQTEGREFHLKLKNLSDPGPEFLEKYGVKKGGVFKCILKVITEGTCSPMLFEFPTIKLDDYPEK